MKIKSKSYSIITEEEMADAFYSRLRSRKGLPDIGPFDDVYREVCCQQGRPDFIGIRAKKGPKLPRFPEQTGLVGPSILALLYTNAPRTLDYLVARSEFFENSIKNTLRQLLEAGLVVRTSTGAFVLGDAFSQLQTEIWAFELKLDNPKRAVFQAQQSRLYANRAMIVVPPGQEKGYLKYSATLLRWGIGVATFDLLNGEFHMMRRGRNSGAICQQHQLYALLKLGSI